MTPITVINTWSDDESSSII